MPASDASDDSFTASASSTNTLDDPHLHHHHHGRSGRDLLEHGEPSFDLEHVQTSTPLKGGRRPAGGEGGGGGPRSASARARGWTSSEDEEGSGSAGEGEALHASDTESVGGELRSLREGDIDRGEGHLSLNSAARRGGAGERLTRRSLLELSSGNNGASASAGGRASSSFLSASATPGATRAARGFAYAPSPSTGSSTLVEEDYTLQQQQKTVTLRGGGGGAEEVLFEERDEDGDAEEGAAHLPASDDDETSSSPDGRRRGQHRTSTPRHKSRIGDLASYVDAKMSAASFSASHTSSAPPPSATTRTTTPPRRSPSSRGRLAPPATPAAPGAYPPTPARPFPSSSSRRSPPSASATGQIHDAFSRLITGPDGALSHAAERRAGLASSQHLHPHHQQQRDQYGAGFVPTSSLPVERRRRDRDREREEDFDAPAHASPSSSKLEQALRQLREAQRSAGGEGLGGAGAGADRSAVEFAMRSFGGSAPAAHEGDEDEYEEEREKEEERLDPRRHHQQQPLRQSHPHSVRFASPPPPASAPSPPRSPSPPPPPPPPRQRSTTPPLPPLPPPILPESPEPQRVRPPAMGQRSGSSFMRRSQAAAAAAAEEAQAQSEEWEPSFTAAAQKDRSPRRARTSSATAGLGPAPPPPPPQPDSAPPLHSSSSSTARNASPALRDNDEDADLSLTLPHLVSQLSSAVKALSAASQSPPDPNSHHPAPQHPSSSSTSWPARTARLNPQGLPSPPREREDGLQRQLERRRKESDRRRRELEGEMEAVAARGSADGVGLDVTVGAQKTRQHLLEQLADTYTTEQELGFKVDDLRRSIEEMGVVVGGEVAAAVGETLKQDGRTRAKWLAWVVGTQLFLFLLFLRLANQHTSSLFPTLYHDPFSPPALFHLPPLLPLSSSSSGSITPGLSAETLAAFAPVARSVGGASVASRVWGAAVSGLARVLPFSSLSSGAAAHVRGGAWPVVPS
ncbi:hypothetical protein JCM6882_005891 [Rhodosporidiobolus microsporus]